MIECVLWCAGLGLWLVNAWWMTFHSYSWRHGRFGELMLRRRYRYILPKPTEQQVRWIGMICLAAGLVFLVASLNQLAHGTLPWRRP